MGLAGERKEGLSPFSPQGEEVAFDLKLGG